MASLTCLDRSFNAISSPRRTWWRKPVVAGGGDQLVVVGVPVDPGQRGADAQLDTAHRITFGPDRGPLGPPQVELRLAQDLDEELLLGFEVLQ